MKEMDAAKHLNEQSVEKTAYKEYLTLDTC
jgi:hypothetical protein